MSPDDLEEMRAGLRVMVDELNAALAEVNAIDGLCARARTTTTLPGEGTPPGGVVVVAVEVTSTHTVAAGGEG